MVQVAVAGGEVAPGGQQALDALRQRDVARQQCQRIRVARRLDARFGDDTHQVLAGREAAIAPVLRPHRCDSGVSGHVPSH
jgi:hypothetical protein